jgi:hypothetical protein
MGVAGDDCRCALILSICVMVNRGLTEFTPVTSIPSASCNSAGHASALTSMHTLNFESTVYIALPFFILTIYQACGQQR